jgi:hypothetical protein
MERISDAELGKMCEDNGWPSVAENLGYGQTQEQATAYLVGEGPIYEDGVGEWLVAYVEWLHGEERQEC